MEDKRVPAEARDELVDQSSELVRPKPLEPDDPEEERQQGVVDNQRESDGRRLVPVARIDAIKAGAIRDGHFGSRTCPWLGPQTRFGNLHSWFRLSHGNLESLSIRLFIDTITEQRIEKL